MSRSNKRGTSENTSLSSTLPLKRQRLDNSLEAFSMSAAPTSNSPSTALRAIKGKKTSGTLKSSVGSGKRGMKLTVKPLRKQNALPADYEANAWKSLQSALDEIFQVADAHMSGAKSLSLEELFSLVETVCRHNGASRLYSLLESDLKARCVTIGEAVSGVEGDLIHALDERWRSFCSRLSLVRQLFLHLDRSYALVDSTKRAIFDLGLHFFKEEILLRDRTADRLCVALLDLIERDRNGELVDRALLKSVLGMHVQLRTYTQYFEKAFVTASTAYYEREAQQSVLSEELSVYANRVSRRMKEEAQRVMTYLDKRSALRLRILLQQTLLIAHESFLTGPGLAALFERQALDDVARLYKLLSGVDLLDAARNTWSAFIFRSGERLMEADGDDSVLIESLLDLHARLVEMVTKGVGDDENFHNALKDSFERVTDLDPNRIAELLAKFVDAKMRNLGKETEAAVEDVLRRCMVLFRFVRAKDVFESFYKRALARRLLLGKQGNSDAEESMLSKLKQECGANFTSKLEGMMKDVAMADDTNQAYGESEHAHTDGDIEFRCLVLTSSFWPNYITPEICLPQHMVAYLDAFRAFYLRAHSGRRLQFQHQLSSCVVKAQTRVGPRELACSEYQALVLMIFNDCESATLSTMVEMLRMANFDLASTVRSLTRGKFQPLRLIRNDNEKSGEDSEKGGASKRVAYTASTAFELNDKFAPKPRKLKLNAAQLRDTEEDVAKVHANVAADRHYQIDAAIVRVMKTRQQISHELLIADVIGMLAFQTQPSTVKARIETLIDREYMEKEGNMYTYLA